ncbi:MAG: diacylglycerol kinase (ATP) [Parasphingorhabdus sp.]|jgi:diacylglycerol kinase (ATP)
MPNLPDDYRQQTGGFKRLIFAGKNSWNGFLSAWREDVAVRQEVLLLLIAIPAAFWLTGDKIERVLLVSSVVIVLIVELLNTAVEAVVDRIGTEHHELSGKAKDVGSTAVFVSLVLAVFVWLIILI